jgi:aspartate/glutamate racemase
MLRIGLIGGMSRESSAPYDRLINKEYGPRPRRTCPRA